MKYDEPKMETVILSCSNIVCTSDTLVGDTPTYGGAQDYEVPENWLE